MTDNNKYIDMIGKFRKEAAEKVGILSEADLDKVIGGVGGANEATCPTCGKAMTAGTYPTIGKGWKCPICGLATDASDAETIQIIRYMEQMGISGIAYPVWWNQIKK